MTVPEELQAAAHAMREWIVTEYEPQDRVAGTTLATADMLDAAAGLAADIDQFYAITLPANDGAETDVYPLTVITALRVARAFMWVPS